MAWKEIGSIRMGQPKNGKPGKLYIKIEDASELKDGVALQIEKPQEKLHRLHELGHLTDEQLADRLERTPDWLKYTITLPPQN